MHRNALWILVVSLALSLLPAAVVIAEESSEKRQGPPPMLVSVDTIQQGEVQPLVEQVGSVEYLRNSRVAGEQSGIVEQVFFEEGSRVKAGEPLLRLNSDLLQASIAGTRASYQQRLIELERARKDLNRITALFREDSIAEVVYDENHYRVLGLEKDVEALKATLDRQLLEQRKMTITAPFSGLVLEKNAEVGEWIAPGKQVALLADDSQVEISVDVPHALLTYLNKGQPVDVRSGDRLFQAQFSHFVPQGDITTRTFSTKLRLQNQIGLVAGMEAHAQLPAGNKVAGLLVHRDAVIKQLGRDVLFLVEDGLARQVPVRIRGYQGMLAALEGEGLAAGQQVVIKGNERIRDGQPVRLQ